MPSVSLLSDDARALSFTGGEPTLNADAFIGLTDIMAGIPLYAPEPGLHDFIVQAPDAFEETVHGILNLASLGQAVEIRVVVQRHTVPVLAELVAGMGRSRRLSERARRVGRHARNRRNRDADL